MKAVAVPYTIAIILGIIVVGLIGYWFVAQGGKTVGVGTKAQCDAKQFNYCQTWKNNFELELAELPSGFTWDESCNSPGIDDCVQILGCKFEFVSSCPIGKTCFWCNEIGCGIVC